MRIQRFVLWCIVFSIFGLGCSPKMTAPAPPNSSLIRDISLPRSTVLMPIVVDRQELNVALQSLVKDVFQEGFILDGGYKCLVSPEGIPDIRGEGQLIHLDLPLNVQIRSTSKWNPLDVAGTIRLKLDTQIALSTFEFKTTTELVAHEWLKKPVIKVVGINLPIEMIANQLIKSYKTTLCQSIDKEIRSAVDVISMRTKLLRYFAPPFFSTDDGGLYAFVTPMEIRLGALRTEGNKLILPTALYFENVISDLRPEAKSHLFQFAQKEVSSYSNSKISIQARIPLVYLQKMLGDSLQAQEFGTDKMRIRIQKFSLQGSGENMIAFFSTVGSFKGDFELKFSPYFNSENNKIVLRGMELKMIKGKGISKTLFNFIRQKVTSMVQKSMEEKLNTLVFDYALTAKDLLNRKEIAKGIYLEGNLQRMDLNQFWIQQGKMFLDVHLYIQVGTSVERLHPSLWKK
jgi:hypothetical protein